MHPMLQEAIAAFRTQLERARLAGEPEHTAMTLATAEPGGRVSARIVLLKDVDERGFAFFTNYDSRKGAQLAAHAQAALCFLWKTLDLEVQVRVEGQVSKLPAAESDAYFATRPRGSQIGAWASLQSKHLDKRETLIERVGMIEREYEGREVPRPPHWGGYVLAPDMIELWHGREYRLHERTVYRSDTMGNWSSETLYP